MSSVALLALAACRAPAPTSAPPTPLSQWVWTEADLAPLAALRRADPAAVAAVHIGTLHHADGRFTTTLALAPTVVDPPRALVVRVDDDAHAAWDLLDDDDLADALTAPLSRLLAMADARGPSVELQLDHDVPVRRLPRWGRVLRRLRDGPLAGRPVWVTSLVAHVRDPAFAPALAGAVDGHVLQVFDTGDVALDVADVRAAADAAGLPYRWGLGAFERGGDAPTDHRAWFAATATCAPPCHGRVVFAAGQPWLHLTQPPP